MKKFLAMLLAGTMALTAAFGVTAIAEETEEEMVQLTYAPGSGQYDLKFSLAISESNFQAQAWMKWADAVSKATDGAVTFTFYYDDTLIDASQEYQQLVAGIADIADVHRYVNDGFNISEKWKSFTAGIPEGSERLISYALWNTYEELRNEYKDVKNLAQSFNGGTMYQLLTVDKPIEKPEDMKGLTIWCEADYNGFVKGCGATPVNTPFSEVYSSLQKHMYDGMMIPTETLKSVNFAEVCKYCNKLNICYATEPGHLMNLNKFNSLPEEYQAVFDDPEIINLVETANMEGFKKVEAVAMKWAEETYGTEEIIVSDENLDAFYQIMADANVATAEELDAKGLPGTDMLNSLKEWSEEFNETGTIAAAGLD